MPIQKTDRDQIIQKAIHCFKIRGFSQTSMTDLGNATGLLKGSLYHYFKNKEEVALACIDWIHHWFDHEVFQVFRDSASPLDQTWKKGWQATLRYFTEREGGCLPGNLTLEIGLSHPRLKKRCEDYFSDWEKSLAIALQRKPTSKAQALPRARSMVAEIQGLLLLERLQGVGLLKSRISEIIKKE